MIRIRRVAARARGRRRLVARAIVISAIALLCTACQPGAGSLEVRLDAVRRLQASGRFQDSIEPLQSILAEAPGHAEANHLLGTAFLRTGAPTLALWPLRRASQDAAFSTESGLLLSGALLSTGNAEQALSAAGVVRERDPTRVEARMLEARAHLKLRDLPAALAALDAFLEVVPGDIQGLWHRAGVLGALERYTEAAEAYTRVSRRAEAEQDAALGARSCTAAALLRLRQDQPERPGRRELDPKLVEPSKLDPEAFPEPSRDLTRSPPVERALRRCLEEHPSEPLTAEALADYLAGTGQPDAGLEVWRKASEAAPDALPLRVGLANQLWVMDRHDEAREVLREATRRSEDPRAWQALAELHRFDGEFVAAAEALAEALARDPHRAELGFLRASLLVDAGRLDEAEALVPGLERSEHRDILRGRILLERGEPEAALRAFDAGLAQWPDNAMARALAGRAAQELGDLDRALEEYRESIRSDARATDAGLAAARIAHALGKHEEAATYAGYQIRSHPYQGLEPYRIGVLAASAAGTQAVVDELLEALERQHRLAEAAVLRAELAGRAGGAAAEVTLLEKIGLDLTEPGNEPALLALVRARLAEGRAEAALALVDRVLRARAESPDLHDARGRILLELGRDSGSQVAFDRALALDPDHPGALAGLGVLAFRRGDVEQASGFFERAVAADPNDSDHAYRAAQLVAELGRADEASQLLRELLIRDPAHVEAANHLAWLLAEKGQDLDLALSLAERAVELEPAAHVLDTLATVQLRRGELESALRTLEGAVALHPGDATLRYRLGTVLLARGQSEAARRAIQQALEAGAFPEAETARATLATLDSGEGGARP